MSEGRGPRRIGRWLAIGGAGTLAAVGLLVLGAYGLLQSEAGRAWMARALEDALSTPGEATVSIGRLHGNLPGEVRLSDVTASDDAGPWLRIDAVAMRWRPLALLSRELDIDALHVGEIELARLPAAAPEAGETAPPGVPPLPLDVTVRELAVQRLALGRPVLGQPATLRVSGRAKATEGDRLASSLVVERTDGVPGRAEVSAAYAPAGDGLTLQAAVNEPEGGLIARALDLPGLPAVAATLSGDGALADWRGDLTATVDGLASASAEVGVRGTDPVALRAAGVATYAGPAERLPWRLLAGDLSFQVEARLSDERELILERTWLDGPAARVELDARLALDGSAVEAHASAHLKDAAAFEGEVPGSVVSGLRLEARAKGPVLGPALDVEAVAERLSAPGLEAADVMVRLALDPQGPLGRANAEAAIAASGKVGDLRADDLAELEPLLDRRVAWRLAGTLDLAAGRLAATDLALESGPTRLAGAGSADLAGGTGRADLRLALGDLAGLSPLLGIEIAGRGEIEARVQAARFGAALDAAVNGTLSDLRLSEPIAHALAAGRATVAADLRLAPGGRLDFANLRAETPAARLEGDLGLSDGFARLEGAYALSMADAGALSRALGLELKGAAEVRGRISGEARNPRIEGRGSLAEARIDSAAARPLRFAFLADDLPTTPSGRIELAATTRAGEVQANTHYIVANPEVRLHDLRAEAPGASLAGELTVRLDDAPARGDLTIEAARLAPWLGLAGIDGDGRARGTLRLAAEGARQGAELSGQVADLRLRLGDGRDLAAERADLALRTTDLTASLAGTASVKAANIALGELRLDTLDLAAEGERARADLRLRATGRFREPLDLDAAGTLRVDRDGLSLDLARAAGRALGQPIELRQAASLAYRPDAVELTGLDLRFGAAELRGDARIGPERVFAEARVKGLPVVALSPLWPVQGIEGEISGEVALDGPRDNPTGRGRVTATGLKAAQIEGAPALGLDVSAEWRDRRLSARGLVMGIPGRDAELALDLPFALAPDGLAVVVPEDAPLSGTLAWSGEIAPVWALAPLADHEVSGRGDISVSLSGTPAAPRVSGAVRLADGTYENLDTGTLLRNLTVRVDFDERRAVLSELSADDGAKGRLRGTGSLRIEPGADYPFDLSAGMTELAVVRRDDVTAVVSDGRLTFGGSRARSRLAGELTTGSVEVRIVDRLPPEVTVLDVVERGAAEKAADRPAGPTGNGGGPEIELDVAVRMPRRVFVRGRGLDSEWSGDLKVTGTARQPAVEGALTLVRGQLSVLTKTFRLKEGTVRFPGGKEVVPVLDVAGEHKAEDLTVTARVKGPATAPAITLSSTPEVPRDEIISRVLFGKKSAQLSPLEAAQLAAAAAELAGTGDRVGGALDFARGLLGVDVLRVGTTGAGEAAAPSVEAGKYVSDDVYVGVKKGVTDESGKVAVEVELTPNISVESETGTAGESDIGIKFKWDY